MIRGFLATDAVGAAAVAIASCGSSPRRRRSPPPDYAIVGQVTRGLDVPQKIESYAPPSGDGTPINNVTITKATLSAS